MRKNQKNKNKFFTKGTIIGIAIIAAIGAAGISYLYYSATPVNSSIPVFAVPTNIYILATHTDQDGYIFQEQSTRQGKKSLSTGAVDVSIHLIKGELVSLHVINEDKDTQSQMDLNIDEFNVHTKKLNPPHAIFFDSQTINFIADKTGTFKYYSTIHPEMKSTIVVEGG